MYCDMLVRGERRRGHGQGGWTAHGAVKMRAELKKTDKMCVAARGNHRVRRKRETGARMRSNLTQRRGTVCKPLPAAARR